MRVPRSTIDTYYPVRYTKVIYISGKSGIILQQRSLQNIYVVLLTGLQIYYVILQVGLQIYYVVLQIDGFANILCCISDGFLC